MHENVQLVINIERARIKSTDENKALTLRKEYEVEARWHGGLSNY